MQDSWPQLSCVPETQQHVFCLLISFSDFSASDWQVVNGEENGNYKRSRRSSLKQSLLEGLDKMRGRQQFRHSTHCQNSTNYRNSSDCQNSTNYSRDLLEVPCHGQPYQVVDRHAGRYRRRGARRHSVAWSEVEGGRRGSLLTPKVLRSRSQSRKPALQDNRMH